MNSAEFNTLGLAFFDIDGTLMRRNFTGTLSLKSRAFNFAVQKVYGIADFDYTRILGKRIFGLTDRSIMKTVLMEMGMAERDYYAREKALFEAIDEYFEEKVAEEKETGYYPLPGIFEFLDKLRAADVRLGLVTGNISRHAYWKMEIAGFDGYFTTGGFGEDAEHRSDILWAGIQRNADIPLSCICHFGDSPPDLEAARTCGIKGIAISDGGGGTHTRDELAAVGYGLIIDSWSATDEIVRYLAR